MRSRLDLHEILKKILGSDYVYFQSPESVKMIYPCIKYSVDQIDTKYANDESYLNKKRYQIIFISKDPDSVIPMEILNLPMCGFDRFYVADNLNHWTFTLYY